MSNSDREDPFVKIKDKLIQGNKADLLVIALVYPAGTEKTIFINQLRDRLKGEYGYDVEVKSISDKLFEHKPNEMSIKKIKITKIDSGSEFWFSPYDEIDDKVRENEKLQKMFAGSWLRKKDGSHYLAFEIIKDIMKDYFSKEIDIMKDYFSKEIDIMKDYFSKAIDIMKDYFSKAIDIMKDYFSKEIFNEKKSINIPPPINNKPKKAYIISSLKTLGELMVLQSVFGKNFYLVSLYDSEAVRKMRLGTHAEDIVKIDQKESSNKEEFWGQNTSDVFHRAHYCFSVMKASNIRAEVERFLKLIFGFPFLAPRLDEYGCYLAFKVALKSMDLSRQVGAVIVNECGDVLSVGANDVQAVGHGYWDAKTDYRDYAMGFEPNGVIVKQWIEELKKNYKDNYKDNCKDNCKDNKEISEELENLIKEKVSVTEFGRAIHAEMDAIMTAHRNGISCKGATIYVTTFPCHNCAKHIAAAGIKRIVFVEPYDKSRAFELHPDLFTMDEKEAQNKVLVSPFVGLGHYKFRDFFSVAGRGLKGGIDRKKELEELGLGRTIDCIKKVVDNNLLPAYSEYESQEWPAGNDSDGDAGQSETKDKNKVNKPKTLRYFSFKHEIVGNYLALNQVIKS